MPMCVLITQDQVNLRSILAYPNMEGEEFVLDTNASRAVLSQKQDGKERVIAYLSRTLNKPESKYCVTRREILAVVYYTRYPKHLVYPDD